MSPPTWQHMPRFVAVSRTVTWLDMLSVKSALSVNLASRFTPFHAEKSVPVAGASPPGVDSGGA
jgi:hypothetical protein